MQLKCKVCGGGKSPTSPLQRALPLHPATKQNRTLIDTAQPFIVNTSYVLVPKEGIKVAKMKYLEVRRHTMRNKPGKHLSQPGIDLARHLGDTVGKFNLVVSSPKPRAIETAIAMGFAIDQEIEEIGLDQINPKLWEEISPEADFGTWSQTQSKLAQQLVQQQATAWQKILDQLPEGGRALLVTHGGLIEAGAVAFLPEATHALWGKPCSYCEGLRISSDGKTRNIEIIRLVEH